MEKAAGCTWNAASRTPSAEFRSGDLSPITSRGPMIGFRTLGNMGKFAGSAVPTPGTHRRHFENVLVDHEQVFFAVCVSEFFIGNAGLKYFEGDCCECWYSIVNELQRGKGYAKEIVNLLCRVAFSIELLWFALKPACLKRTTRARRLFFRTDSPNAGGSSTRRRGYS